MREALAGPVGDPPQRTGRGAMGPGVDAGESTAAAARPAQLPTIQVTIGRIEVRAAAPPPTPARPAPRRSPVSSAPSLGEYLKRGSGGGP